MKKTRLDLGARSYDILIGSGVIKKLPGLIRSMYPDSPVVVVTDSVVSARTRHITGPIFKRLRGDVIQIRVPSSEKSKSIEVFQEIVRKISKKTKKHRPVIVAVGGGVVGDLGGFVAATYRRGVPLIQVPTTLLAQVDSSVGGKTGVDLADAKNIIGAFCQPKAVLMDTDFLRTLPKRQIRNGMAEVIKYALIRDRKFFDFLNNNIKNIVALKKKTLEKTIYECVNIKARVVEKDELDEKDIRIALNFGHTLGHAIEAASEYSGRYNHGESIAVGMVLASEIALRLGMIKEGDLGSIIALFEKASLPVRARGVSVQKIMKSHEYDKKFTTGTNRFVLPTKIGSVKVVEEISVSVIKAALRKYVE